MKSAILLLALTLPLCAADPVAASDAQRDSRERAKSAAAIKPEKASKAAPFINSLGMEFVPVNDTPGLLWSRWETRVQDYAAFCTETDRAHEKPDFQQGNDHPVVNVTFEDAEAFCAWLSKKERATFRLPTNAEWNVAAGLGVLNDPMATPKARLLAMEDTYAWGTSWPPPRNCGNYDPVVNVDSFDKTSPVGKFPPTSHGIFDLGGNVWEWCATEDSKPEGAEMFRGGSWNSNAAHLLLSCRIFTAASSRSKDRGFRVVLETGSKS